MPPREQPNEHEEPISVSSDVLGRLGEELITNHIQALAELVKNAYDADASVVKLDIETQRLVTSPSGEVRKGVITIADNGFGMDDRTVRRGWLRVSASPKRAMKEAGLKTPKKRTPLGDKGLGRLGAQRLGDRVRIRTRPQLAPDDTKSPAYIEHDVAFEFSKFRSDQDVGELRVPWIEYALPAQENLTEPWPNKKSTGTVIEISGLTNPDDWSDHQELERALSLLVNPFKGIEKFSVSVRVDGNSLNLHSVATEVRNAALSRWEGTFDGETLIVEGMVRLLWFNVRDRRDQELLASLLDQDRGAGLRSFVLTQTADEPFEVTPGKKPWLLKFRRKLRLEDLDKTGLDLEPEPGDATPKAAEDQSDGPAETPEYDEDESDGRRPISPGEFLFELDVVSRRLATAREAGLSALGRQKDYKDWLDERGGVHVYRDGFRINLSDDVMAMGEAFSSSSSYYGLRPANAIGYVEISAEHNVGLEETTDREGFRETPEYRTFRRLIYTVRDEINEILDVMGRSTIAYLRSIDADPDRSTEELADELTGAAQEATEARRTVATAQAHVHTASVAESTDVAAKDEALRAAEKALAAADVVLERMVSAERLGAVVRRDVAELTAQLEEYAQLIGLGLVAETLAHELNHVSGRLSGQVTDLQTRDDLQPSVKAYLQETRSALDALHGQLRHLDPMLRYARTRRENIDLGLFVAQMSEFHAQRLHDKRIEITSTIGDAAEIRANRGRLMQVFDNVVINAEYWLEQALDAGRIAQGRIAVEVDGATITFRDNGPGVDKDMEPKIFEPFVTAKSAARGRGLGLYICRQLLDLDGGTISLGAHRNKAGRSDTFVVSFEG